MKPVKQSVKILVLRALKRKESYEDIAERLGISKSTVYRIYRDSGNYVSLRTRKKITNMNSATSVSPFKSNEIIMELDWWHEIV